MLVKQQYGDLVGRGAWCLEVMHSLAGGLQGLWAGGMVGWWAGGVVGWWAGRLVDWAGGLELTGFLSFATALSA